MDRHAKRSTALSREREQRRRARAEEDARLRDELERMEIEHTRYWREVVDRALAEEDARRDRIAAEVERELKAGDPKSG